MHKSIIIFPLQVLPAKIHVKKSDPYLINIEMYETLTPLNIKPSSLVYVRDSLLSILDKNWDYSQTPTQIGSPVLKFGLNFYCTYEKHLKDRQQFHENRNAFIRFSIFHHKTLIC